ncbi:TOMM precursor leader peptide-binding protein [Kitasatospora sp. NPDC051170]|uniref:TOMM precursor leader peptide-binding protein n=1 Tax=Kitasatospora sp. NPDC051170 TaxID=3364056 RepID=UPI0037900131
MADTGARGLPLGFKRHLRAEVVPGEATYLLSANGVTAVAGRHVERLAPLLDGTRSLERVLDEAADTMTPGEASRVLARLAQAKLLGYHRPAEDEAALAYWDLLGLDGADSSLARAAVRVVTLGRPEPGPARRACRESGLRVLARGERPGPDTEVLTLVLTDDYLHPELERINAEHLAAGTPWLLARPCGAQPWVGPVFRPQAGPCWSCLAHRLWGHRHSEIPLQRALGHQGPVARPEASLAAGRAMGLQAAVLAAARWLAGARGGEDDAVCTLDTATLRSRHHTVVRRPQCPECGDPGLVARQVLGPLVVRPRPKSPETGGGHRALAPAEMLRRHEHLVSPVTGIVEEVRRDERAPEGINCYVSGRNLAMRSGSLGGLRAGLRALSGGKGATALDAKVGALCEAAERYSGTRQGDEPVVRDSLRALGPVALHPNDCQLYSERQFRERARWNASGSALHHVPERFDPDRPVDWTPVQSLTTGRQRLLPTSLLYYGNAPGRPSDGLWADSNGNAAGSSLEDAIVQGFLELVERDAVALWWYNRTRHPAVDLDAFDDPWTATLRQAYAMTGRQVWVLDVTSDFGIPVFVALSRQVGRPAEEIAFGFGAHHDPRLALRRALTEMGQFLPSGGSPDGGLRAADPEVVAWWSSATVANQPYLLPDSGQVPRRPSDYDYRPSGDLREDVAEAERLVRAKGMELLVLDQTRPDVEIPVVKVIAPGMRHFWARFAPGRIFDVPVRLGLLTGPTVDTDLNPIPLFV